MDELVVVPDETEEASHSPTRHRLERPGMSKAWKIDNQSYVERGR